MRCGFATIGIFFSPIDRQKEENDEEKEEENDEEKEEENDEEKEEENDEEKEEENDEEKEEENDEGKVVFPEVETLPTWVWSDKKQESECIGVVYYGRASMYTPFRRVYASHYKRVLYTSESCHIYMYVS